MIDEKEVYPWIRVEDSLPLKDEVVDIWFDNKRCTNYKYTRDYAGRTGNDFFEPTISGYSCVRLATHWMRLPKPPIKKEWEAKESKLWD